VALKRPVVLVIAGSDSGGGAGLQADVKAIHAQGAYAVTVVTAVTAQNTLGVRRWEPVALELVLAQLDAVFEDFEVAAVKTGMLGHAGLVELVASELARREVRPVVVDPVMVSGRGEELLEPEGVEALAESLLPLADVVTPNVPEAERLAGMAVTSAQEMEEAGRRILERGVGHVLVKGGHLASGGEAVDVLVGPDFAHRLTAPRIPSRTTHGTGCTLASALAARLAFGEDVPSAARAAKAFVTEAIRYGLALGAGNGPVDPLYGIPGASEE
jgi:hydroxymethylpyrimidine/phosphomethylpyrimidine kinase